MVMPVLSEAGHEEQQQQFVGEKHERPPCQIERRRFGEYKEDRSRLDRSGTKGKDGPLDVAEMAMAVGEKLQDISWRKLWIFTGPWFFMRISFFNPCNLE